MAKIITENKRTCDLCGNVWYFGMQEEMENTSAELMNSGKAMSVCCTGCLPAIFLPNEKVVEYDKCPKCGSRAVKKEVIKYDVDQIGQQLASDMEGICLTCKIPLALDNQTGFCSEHQPSPDGKEPKVASDMEGCCRTCKIPLALDNQTGFCHEHQPPPEQPKAETTKKCPFCAEMILIEARKCKHCGEFLDDTHRNMK